MNSANIMLLFCFQYAVCSVVSFAEQNWVRGFYWLFAIGLNVCVMMGTR